MESEQKYNPMQVVKRRFFAMRNGVIADVYRKAGSAYKVIFGLNLPQISDIAHETGADAELSEQLWNNSATRESRLLAPMIMPRDSFGEDRARQWCGQVDDYETADILCHRLLRHMPYAVPLSAELSADPSPMMRYVGVRLAFNILYGHRDDAVAAARRALAVAADDAAGLLARRLLTEADQG